MYSSNTINITYVRANQATDPGSCIPIETNCYPKSHTLERTCVAKDTICVGLQQPMQPGLVQETGLAGLDHHVLVVTGSTDLEWWVEVGSQEQDIQLTRCKLLVVQIVTLCMCKHNWCRWRR